MLLGYTKPLKVNNSMLQPTKQKLYSVDTTRPCFVEVSRRGHRIHIIAGGHTVLFCAFVYRKSLLDYLESKPEILVNYEPCQLVIEIGRDPKLSIGMQLDALNNQLKQLEFAFPAFRNKDELLEM